MSEASLTVLVLVVIAAVLEGAAVILLAWLLNAVHFKSETESCKQYRDMCRTYLRDCEILVNRMEAKSRLPASQWGADDDYGQDVLSMSLAEKPQPKIHEVD